MPPYRHYILSCILASGEAGVNETDATDVVTALFDRWHTPLIRYAVRSMASFDLAEDLVQDAFMELYQALRAGKDIAHPKAWTLCVLRRAVSRQLQSRDRHEQLSEFDLKRVCPNEGVDVLVIQELLSLLSRREEEVLLLRLEAMKYREIADHLGISMNSVNTLLARALRKLQKGATAKRPISKGGGIYEETSLGRAS